MNTILRLINKIPLNLITTWVFSFFSPKCILVYLDSFFFSIIEHVQLDYHFWDVFMRSINWVFVQLRGWCFLMSDRVCQWSSLNVLAAVKENSPSTRPNTSSAVFLLHRFKCDIFKAKNNTIVWVKKTLNLYDIKTCWVKNTWEACQPWECPLP